MKRAVKWISTESMSIDQGPGRKEQDGQCRPLEKGSMLCILTSKRVLRTPFAGQNRLSDA